MLRNVTLQSIKVHGSILHNSEQKHQYSSSLTDKLTILAVALKSEYH